LEAIRDDGGSFTDFVRETEPRLRHALIAAYGQELGRECVAEALAYGWQHWERLSTMDNPAGYLYRVARSKGRRRKRPVFAPVPEHRLPHVEPGLPNALAKLSEKQRVAVVMVHAYDWPRHEVAAMLDVSVSTLDTHLQRGLFKLRGALGVTDA